MATQQPNTPDPFASLGGGIYQNGGWLPPGHPAIQQGQEPTATAPPPSAGPTQPGTPTAPAAPTTPTGAPLATNAAQISQPFYQTLHSILSRPQTVTANDPQVKETVNASRAEEERNFARSRQMMAERSAAEGTNMSGAFDANLANQRAGIGARQSSLVANLLREAQGQRDTTTLAGLGVGQGIMSDSDRNILQRELAGLDAALRREGMGIDREQIEAGKEEGAAERALRRALADQSTGFNYAQLGQQGEQFGQNLSANIGMNEAQLNQALVLALLQGGA